MVGHVGTVATQALQVWTEPSEAELGLADCYDFACVDEVTAALRIQ